MGKKGIRIRDIEHLKKVLKDSKFKIEAAFLFGSRAGDEFLEDSDWDLMIISDDFKGIPFIDRATFFPEESPNQESRYILLCKQRDCGEKKRNRNRKGGIERNKSAIKL